MNNKKDINTSNKLIDFIKNSPTAFHVVKNFSEMLEKSGFTKLNERDKWKLKTNGKYYVTRNDSSIIAFCMPEKEEFYNFQIAAAHSDSPAFKIKENPEMVEDNSYVTLNVEKYGGMLMAPWLDRPLSVAGRVIVKEGTTLKPVLINIDRDLCAIPNLAIHMNRDANSGIKYNPQKDMIPLFGEISAKNKFEKIIAKEANTDTDSIISTDLFLYNREKGTVWGADNEFISAPRLDDVMCAYSCINALIKSKETNKESVNVCAVFDNEEVGSTTKQGADSSFLTDVLSRISMCKEKDNEDFVRACASSFMLSADNAHAVHPNYKEKADPTNRPYMNKGIVIKYNANQKYTTDAVSAAIFKEICKKAEVPVQSYVNRSDIPGGSTLGNISNSHISLNTVDIGLAQLAMHSPYETAGVKDTELMIKAVKKFYETTIIVDEGIYKLK
ncbi:M18 family aminopeptidase [uncultured Eubacterium sp.]|uniref:M18 family aminopeptidase n=1 Tax=uncultured Eubacterium sp. TaxID=165185 RepID=UPI003264E104